MPKLNSPKIPPHADEVEESVLGAILIDKDAITAVAPILKSEFFYNDRNALIFQTALSLYEKRRPIDLVTLTEALRKKGRLRQADGAAYLTKLTNKVPTAANIEEYAQIVKECWIKRRLISVSSRISESSFDEGKESADILDKAEQEIFSLSQSNLRKTFIPIKEALVESFDRLDELHKRGSGLRGVSTGLKDLDDMLAGMQNSNMLVLAARPGIGKTALGLNIARHVAVEEKIPVGIFSLEMSQEELVDRLLVRQSEIDSWKLKTGRLDQEDFSRLSDGMGVLAEAPLFIDDTPGISVMEMRTKARRLKAEKGLGFLIADYLQLIHGRHLENRVQEVSEISQSLKNLARELKIPVLAISQLSRAVEMRGGRRPRLADLRESGCISGDTLIQMANGQQVTIEKLSSKNKPFLVMSLNEKTWHLEPALAKKAWCSGEKIVLRLKTQLGQEVKASANHKFRTPDGWKRLDQLKTGDYISLVRSWKNLPKLKPTMTTPQVALLGHLIGDGCTLPRHAIQYTTNERELAETVVGLSNTIFGKKINPRISRERNWWQAYLPASYHLTHHKRNPIAEWMDKLKIWGYRSGEKRVPEKIFKQPPQRISQFLHHLWVTDGSITIAGKKKPRPIIYYATSSPTLAKNTQHLLRRLGIIARVRRVKQKNKGKDQWHIIITGKPDITTFIKVIGTTGKKLKNLTLIKKFYQNHHHNPNKNIIPKIMWHSQVEPARQALGMTQREMQKQIGVQYCGSTLFKANMSRQRALRVAQVVQSETLEKIAKSDIYWDKIASIKLLGIEKVYDLEVPGHHNFIAEDIIVHNSIEQDADVVMFLFHKDEDDKENVTLEIAKHRNGPTGQINIRFVPERISFYPLEQKRKK